MRIRFIGERSAFQPKLREQMEAAERRTAANDGLELAIAVNYGGRWDIVSAARAVAREVAAGRLDAEAIDLDTFARHVSLSGVSDPDLFIRTGGEKRISNYLLWHLAYTELFFTDVLWPDFDDVELGRALDFYAGRQRRFGPHRRAAAGRRRHLRNRTRCSPTASPPRSCCWCCSAWTCSWPPRTCSR